MILKEAVVTTLSFGLILANLAGFCYGALMVGFYRGKCGVTDVEAIVAGVITGQFIRDPTIVAALLRLQFHDCFVRGCDASILLEGVNSEKTSSPNLSVRGYEIIDEAKDAVENFCPGLVSCADLIAISTRDAVFLSGGGRYEVETGRRDGLVSVGDDVNLPGPDLSVPQSIILFGAKGLSPSDMVILLGAHTVGVTHCSFINDRLFNFNQTGRPDPTLDPSLADVLRSRCPQDSNVDNTVDLDQMQFSPFILDNSYFKQVMFNRGVLQIDQEVGSDPLTRGMVTTLANRLGFPSRFGAAMVKLGAVEVLTGRQGEIRRSCRAINKQRHK